MTTLATIFLSEVVGTAMLLLLGAGVVANNILPKNKGNGTGFLMVNFGWGLAVFAGVLVSYKSGGHINPAVTLGLVASGATEFAPGVPVDAAIWEGKTALMLAVKEKRASVAQLLLEHGADPIRMRRTGSSSASSRPDPRCVIRCGT